MTVVVQIDYMRTPEEGRNAGRPAGSRRDACASSPRSAEEHRRCVLIRLSESEGLPKIAGLSQGRGEPPILA